MITLNIANYFNAATSLKNAFFILILLALSCTNIEKKVPKFTDGFSSSVPKDSGTNYYSNDLLFATEENKFNEDSFVRQWYSTVLYGLHEPVLYNYKGRGEAVRLLLLPSFGRSILIRLNNFNDTVYANVKTLNVKQSVTDIPEINTDTLLILDIKKWKEALSMLDVSRFWNTQLKDSTSHLYKDGVSWFFECQIKNKYHSIERWDDGTLSSPALNLYAKVLIDIGKVIVPMEKLR